MPIDEGGNMAAPDTNLITFDPDAGLRLWLAADHQQDPPVWLLTLKKLSGDPHVGCDDRAG